MKLVYFSTLERNPNLKEKYLKIIENNNILINKNKSAFIRVFAIANQR